MAEKREKSPTYVRTGRVMLSYPKLFVAFAGEDGGTPKYSTCIIIPKKDKKTIAAIEDAIEAAKQLGKSSKFGGKIPKPCKVPLRDGDEEKDTDEHPEFKNSYFINCSTQRRPSVVDIDLEEITRRDDVYGGNIARVTLNFYPFDMGKNKGIAAGLNNVQILEAGEPLGAGSSSAEDDFGDDDDEEDEPKPRKKKKVVVDDDDDEEDEPKPRKKKKKVVDDDDEEDEPKPRKKKKVVVDDDDEEDEPKPRKKKKVVVDDDDELD